MARPDGTLVKTFEQKLSKRDIYIHYDLENFLSDVETLEKLDKGE